MRIYRIILIIAFACLTFSSVARGQYRWRLVLPIQTGDTNYEFTALDCWHNVCTVAAIRRIQNIAFTDNYFTLLFFRSTDGGETWNEQDPGLPRAKVDNNDYFQQVQQIDSLHAVAMSDSGVVVVTDDGGNTWERRDLPVKWDQREFHFHDPMTGIVTLWSDYADNIYTTNNGGATWNRSPWSPWLTATMSHSDGGEQFRVVTYADGPLYYTEDDWNTVDSTSLIVPHGGPGDTEIVGGCQFRGDTLVAYGLHGNPHGGANEGALILTSVDNGVTWSPINLSPKEMAIKTEIDCMSSLDENTVFASGPGYDRHLFKSTDHGLSWAVDTFIYSSDTTQYETSSIAVTNGGNALAIIDPGFEPFNTELMIGELSREGVSSLTPTQSLAVYPNPATQSITISSLASARRVDVLDLLGRVALRGTVSPDGQLRLDISTLPAGVYYVSDGTSRAKFLKE